MRPGEGCGHLYGTGVRTTFSVGREHNSAYSVALLNTLTNGIRDDDIDNGYRDKVSAITETRVSDNSRSGWCYKAQYIGYSLVN